MGRGLGAEPPASEGHCGFENGQDGHWKQRCLRALSPALAMFAIFLIKITYFYAYFG